jgi:monoamine oxidase
LRQPEIHDFLEAVEAWQAAKLYLWYDRAWWRDDGFRGRRTTTDLPARKLFYFDGHGAGDPSVLLAAYTDGGDVEPWRAVSDGAAAGSQAPSAMLKLVNQQLAIIHPGVEIPDPAGSAFVHWGADPLEAGWHYWRAGARSWDVMPAVLRPDPTRSAYICGEAYSTSQAWVEGALETAAMVVGRVLSD